MPDPSRFRSLIALRGGLTAAAVAGCATLVAATFTKVVRIEVGTSTKAVAADTMHNGWDRHGPALLLLAVLAAGLLAAALRGVRAAMTGLAVTGIAALAIAMAWDRPYVHDTGTVGELYADATAGPGAGYYLETLGGALLLLSGGGLLVLGRPTTTTAASPRRPPAEE